MAQSPTELAREVQKDLAVLQTVVGALREQYAQSNPATASERIAVLEREVENAELSKLRERIALLERDASELKELRAETGRRLWQIGLLLVGSIVTLAINLTVSFLVAFYKK